MLFTKAIREQLEKNGRMRTADPEGDGNFVPVVKLFNAGGAGTWLLTDIDPEDDDRAFGLCDLGMGYPELGYVSLREIQEIRSPFGLGIERDLYFEGKAPIADYARAATLAGYIVEHLPGVH